MNKGIELVKTFFENKIFLLCLIVIICVASITIFILKSNENDIKTFTKISEVMSKNLNQLRDTQGINLTGFAADPSKKLIKIGINVDTKKITSLQLKQAVESYLANTISFTSEHNWKSSLGPYNLRIEELTSGKLIAEKPLGATEITWK